MKSPATGAALVCVVLMVVTTVNAAPQSFASRSDNRGKQLLPGPSNGNRGKQLQQGSSKVNSGKQSPHGFINGNRGKQLQQSNTRTKRAKLPQRANPAGSRGNQLQQGFNNGNRGKQLQQQSYNNGNSGKQLQLGGAGGAGGSSRGRQLQQGGGQEGPPAEYNFEWNVDAEDYSNYYGQRESASNGRVEGSYYVWLPDERLMRVDYYVDGDSGYVPTITYEKVSKPNYGTTPFRR